LSRAIPAVVLTLALAALGCAGPHAERATYGAETPRVQAESSDPAPSSVPASSVGRSADDSDSRVIARVNQQPITLQQLQEPLIEAHGLNILLNLVQLEMARQNAAAENIHLTTEDYEQERRYTLQRMFETAYEDQALKKQEREERRRAALAEVEGSGEQADAQRHEVGERFDQELAEMEREFESDLHQYFEQFIAQERITRPEFELVLKTNATLRKLAEPVVRQRITDEMVREAYLALYGETVQARHIQAANMQEIAEVRRRLAEGHPFEQVAREMSRNPRTAGLGGELPVFSRAMTGLPEAFKEAAFALQPGEVSDPVLAEGAYHLIKVEQRFEPRAVRFEDVKETVRLTVHEQFMQATIRELRGRLAQQALDALQIEDALLRRQFEQRMSQRQAQHTAPAAAAAQQPAAD
jgi:parvulin-like peptidyl-prolyl isomerase